MRSGRVLGLLFVFCAVAYGDDELKSYDLEVGGEPWLRTIVEPLDTSSDARRDLTYKVHTQVFDFDGDGFLTKGAGGKFTHHRGLFIGWKDTLVDGTDYDTWHMSNCSQAHVEWLEQSAGEDAATQAQRIEWRDDEGDPFISEVRTIAAKRGDGSSRVIDFTSELTAVTDDIQLRGDLQHAGMQIRMANEVSEHEESTQYILPEGAKELDDDKVVGAWWVLGSVIVEGKRWWVLHMTHPSLVTGEPVYSIRRYARFGSFFEPDLKQGEPLALRFRIVVSEDELTRPECEALFASYSETTK